MNAPSQTAVIHKSSEANLSLSATLFVWVCAKSRKKKKKEKKKKKVKKRKEEKKTHKINCHDSSSRFTAIC